jgi:hypothetical protein
MGMSRGLTRTLLPGTDPDSSPDPVVRVIFPEACLLRGRLRRPCVLSFRRRFPLLGKHCSLFQTSPDGIQKVDFSND